MKKEKRIYRNLLKEEGQKNKGGRPTTFNQEIADRICNLIATTDKSLVEICESDPAFPFPATILDWKFKNDKFYFQYVKAKSSQAELLTETCLDIAKKCTRENYGSSRLQIDTIKWLAGKLAPKIYGDKFVMEQKTEENEELKKELLELRASLEEKYRKDY